MLTDGTTEIAETNYQEFVAGDNVSATVCGIYNVASLVSTTLKIQTKASANAVTIAGGSGNSSIEWSIFELDAPTAMPVITGGVTTSSAGNEYAHRANITCSSSSAVNSQEGTWITSVGNVSSGKCIVTLAVAFASTAYDCSFTRNGTAVTSIVGVSINNKATTSFDMYMALISTGSSTIGAGTSESFDVQCMGPR